jgi:hypothetical protein
MAEIYGQGRQTEQWIVTSPAAFKILASIVCLYDRLVHTVNLGGLEKASERLAHSKATEFRRLHQKRGA